MSRPDLYFDYRYFDTLPDHDDGRYVLQAVWHGRTEEHPAGDRRTWLYETAEEAFAAAPALILILNAQPVGELLRRLQLGPDYKAKIRAFHEGTLSPEEYARMKAQNIRNHHGDTGY